MDKDVYKSKIDSTYIIESKDVIIGLLQEEVKHLRQINAALIETLKKNKSVSPTIDKPNYFENPPNVISNNVDTMNKINIIKTINQWQKPKRPIYY